jgi:hypothetical protein
MNFFFLTAALNLRCGPLPAASIAQMLKEGGLQDEVKYTSSDNFGEIAPVLPLTERVLADNDNSQSSISPRNAKAKTDLFISHTIMRQCHDGFRRYVEMNVA